MGAETSKPSASGDDGTTDSEVIRGINRMDSRIRQKIRQGFQYDMKIVIRGSRGSGKTSLWKRLQALPFSSEHEPTPEIQIASINWNYKNFEDTVKVDVWDVVDYSSRPGNDDDAPAGLADAPTEESGIENSNSKFSKSAIVDKLDSTTIDIYKNAHAVVFLVNPQDPSSIDYLRLSVPEVPLDVSVLILLNFRDVVFGETQVSITLIQLQEFCIQMTKDRHDRFDRHLKTNAFTAEFSWFYGSQSKSTETSPNTIQQYAITSDIRTLDKSVCNVYCFETSMLNCYGLKNLYKYLNIPFVILKQHTLHLLLRSCGSDLIEFCRVMDQNVEDANKDYFDYVTTRQARHQHQEVGQKAASEGNQLPTKNQIETINNSDNSHQIKTSTNNLSKSETKLVNATPEVSVSDAIKPLQLQTNINVNDLSLSPKSPLLASDLDLDNISPKSRPPIVTLPPNFVEHKSFSMLQSPPQTSLTHSGAVDDVDNDSERPIVMQTKPIMTSKPTLTEATKTPGQSSRLRRAGSKKSPAQTVPPVTLSTADSIASFSSVTIPTVADDRISDEAIKLQISELSKYKIPSLSASSSNTSPSVASSFVITEQSRLAISEALHDLQSEDVDKNELEVARNYVDL